MSHVRTPSHWPARRPKLFQSTFLRSRSLAIAFSILIIPCLRRRNPQPVVKEMSDFAAEAPSLSIESRILLRPRAEGLARCRSGGTLRRPDQGVQSGGKAQPETFSGGFHVPAHTGRGPLPGLFKVTNCDLKAGAASQVRALCLHGAGNRKPRLY